MTRTPAWEEVGRPRRQPDQTYPAAGLPQGDSRIQHRSSQECEVLGETVLPWMASLRDPSGFPPCRRTAVPGDGWACRHGRDDREYIAEECTTCWRSVPAIGYWSTTRRYGWTGSGLQRSTGRLTRCEQLSDCGGVGQTAGVRHLECCKLKSWEDAVLDAVNPAVSGAQLLARHNIASTLCAYHSHSINIRRV